MTYYVFSGTLNPAQSIYPKLITTLHSMRLTQSLHHSLQSFNALFKHVIN